MTPNESNDREVVPDAVDVVDGPIGSARLKEPTTSGPTGADLGALPDVKLPAGIDNADRDEVRSGAIDRS